VRDVGAGGGARPGGAATVTLVRVADPATALTDPRESAVPAVESAEAVEGGEPRQPPRRRRRALAALVLALLVAGPVLLRVELADRRDDAAGARATAADAAAERRAVEGRVAAEGDRLVTAAGEAAAAASALAAERARLAELGLTEASLDRVVRGLRADVAASEALRTTIVTGIAVQQEQIPQMKQCLMAARSAVDAAFHASNHQGVAVPAPSEVCRALAAALPSNAVDP